MNKSSLLSVFLLLLLISPVGLSQNEGRWYQVEILIFKRAFEPVDNELWRNDIQLTYPENSQYISETLPNTTHELGGHSYTLKKDGSYEVLFHKAWNQQMQGKEDSPALIIRGGESYGPHRELEGSIRIHIGRYLHVTTDLWLSEFIIKQAGQQNLSANNWPNLPTPSGINSALDTGYVPSRIVAMREKRRMRSKETHYIDHPMMGILVRMLPIKAPIVNAAR